MIVLYTTVGCEAQTRMIILQNLVFSELWKLTFWHRSFTFNSNKSPT